MAAKISAVKKRPATAKTILPKERRPVWSARAFVEELPDVALSVAESRFGPNARVVLENYILKQSSRKTSFSAIAHSVGITKQAAHAVFQRMIRKFREVMLEDKYRMCSFRLRPEFLRPLRILSKKVRQRKTVLRQNDWNALLAKTWGISGSQLGPMEPFILEILGLRRHDFRRPALDSIIDTAADKTKTRLDMADRFIRGLLRSHHPSGLTLQQLTDAIKARSGLRRLSTDKIRVLVRSMGDVEKLGSLYRVPDRRMSRRADHYAEILRRAGKPLHYRELAHRALRFGYRGNDGQRQSVTNILVKDSRFAPVAQSGFWALATWRNLETRTITDIAFDEIKRAGQPLHEKKLYMLIRKRRSVKRRSVPRMLAQSRRFKSLGNNLWTICE